MAKGKASAASKHEQDAKARRPLTLVTPPDDKQLEGRSELLGLLISFAALGYALALWSYDAGDMTLVYEGRGSSDTLANLTGPVGARIADLSLGLLGLGAWAVDGLLWVIGLRTLVGRNVVPSLRTVVGSLTFTLGTLSLLHLIARGLELRPYGKDAAGLVGSAASELLRAFLSTAGAAVLSLLLITASVSAISEQPLFRIAARWMARHLRRWTRAGADGAKQRMGQAWAERAERRSAEKAARAEAAAAAAQAQHDGVAEPIAATDDAEVAAFAAPDADARDEASGRVAMPDTRPSNRAVLAETARRPSAVAIPAAEEPRFPSIEPLRESEPPPPPAPLAAAPIADAPAPEPPPLQYDADGFPIGTPLAPKTELVPSAQRRVAIGVGTELVGAGSEADAAVDEDEELPTEALVFDLDTQRAVRPATTELPPLPTGDDDDDDALPTMQIDAISLPTRAPGRAIQAVAAADDVAAGEDVAVVAAQEPLEATGEAASEPETLKEALAAARAGGPRIVETEAMRNKGSTSAVAEGHDQGALDIGDKKTWRLPPRFLVQPPPDRVVAAPYDVLVDNARILEQKLADFKIQGEVTDIRPGPVVTTYEYRPAPGVKISRIANLKDDLTMSLAALRVRVVAPIPGRDVVGIEVPNKQRQIVYFREIIESKPYADSNSKLTIVLGKDIEGAPVCTDLAKAPHLLVAGATGTGKSVGINSFLASMLFKATPDDVRLLLIDPKVLELSVYEGIPHLMLPVIDDPHKAELALKWACREMDRRYHILADAKVRNVAGYKSKLPDLRERARKSKVAVKNGRKVLVDANSPGAELLEAAAEPEDMPYIVIVIDEFADLIMASGKEVERAVARLAQKARAAGIHVILATQRPSTDVITGMIKANFPTRISFQVASSIDSKVVLNSVGAESLLGMGDMLFVPPGTSHVRRCHGCWITDDEVVKLSEHWRDQGEPVYDLSILEDPESEAPTIADDEELDPLFSDAVSVVIEAGQASVSFLQRKLGIGYGRSARIIDHMEARGIVGPQRGPNKPREILADGGYGNDFDD
ncbi:MAG: DNA translocase FtsK 4TM domain-containing protein [Deltaproteobacteria bacterium]|nr:DNA translocase FtsK 4TM domain-containing protein [Deltaproteobacteria bacterium]